MFNKQQINALWGKITGEIIRTKETIDTEVDDKIKSHTYKETSVSELKTMMEEGTLVPGVIYSYDVGSDDNSITIYQTAKTPNKLEEEGILISDDDKYNEKKVIFDLASYPEDSSVLVVMSKDKDNLFIYEDGVLKEVACKVAETANGRLAYNRIPTNYYIPEEFTPGVYLVRVDAALEVDNPVAGYGGLVRLSLGNNVVNVEVIDNGNHELWSVKENKFITKDYELTDETTPFIYDVIRQIYDDRLPDGVDWNVSLASLNLDEIGPIISIIDPEH